MARKCYNLIIEEKGSKELIAKFMFDEKDQKGLQDKAHPATIDRLTTKYKSDSELFHNFEGNNTTFIKVVTSVGRVSIPDITLFMTHNAGGLKKEKPLYNCYKEIIDIPLRDITTCDKSSQEFKEFYYNFKWLLLNNPYFYNYFMNSNYYHTSLKEEVDAVINGYRIDTFHERLLIDYLTKYTTMRKSYKDVIDYNKKI